MAPNVLAAGQHGARKSKDGSTRHADRSISFRVTESRVRDCPPGTSQSRDDCKQLKMLQEPHDRIHPQALSESGPEQDGDVNVNSDEEVTHGVP